MGNKDLSEIGEQIKKSVETALGSMDFEQLNKNISDSVGNALDEARKSLVKAGKTAGSKAAATGQAYSREYAEKFKTYKNKDDEGVKKQENLENPYQGEINQGQLNWEKANKKSRQAVRVKGVHVNSFGEAISAAPSGVRVNYPSRVAGILYIVFGAIGIGVSAILLLSILFISIVTKPLFGVIAGSGIFFLALLIIFLVMLGAGKSRLGRIKRLKSYLKEAGDKNYCLTEKLSAAVGRSLKYVLKDIDRMISGGILPEARWDEKKTCLMLNQAAYKQYREAVKSFEKRNLEQQEEARRQAEEKEIMTGIPAELRQMIEEGDRYVGILREANDAIPGELISAKLSRLEAVISRIFEALKKHPEQTGGMERFMEYYLPTTVKLVNAYRDFDSVDVAGENVDSAKMEIENTLDTINQAFERLLDDLYAEAALDVSTDASVLQSMLKKDGFTDSDFK